jgi:hypothetical protein
MRSSAVVLTVLLAVLLVVLVPGAAQAQKKRTGKLEVKVSVEGATIYVDGAEIATSPMGGPVTLAVGKHTLKVSKPGHAEYLDTVTITPNEQTTVDVDLVPFAAVVNVASDPPGAELAVDGKLVGETPTRVDLDPGKHTLRLSLDGYHDTEHELEVVAGESYDVNLKLVALPPPPVTKKRKPGKPIYKKWWFWAASGAVAVGVTAIAIGASSGGDPLGGADKIVDVQF